MKINDIPLLNADDIECRIQQVKESRDKQSVEALLLLYKNARCDMKYLDMIFGSCGWKRSHRMIGDRLYCTVSIWDEVKEQWIDKEDVGTESNTEKEKGQASDSFKRACFNIGIGRELYTAPFVKIQLSEKEYSKKGEKYASYASFTVKHISYDENRCISELTIVDRFGNVRFTRGQPDTENQQKISAKAVDTLSALMAERKLKNSAATVKYYAWLKKKYNINSFNDLTENQYISVIDVITKWWPEDERAN